MAHVKDKTVEGVKFVVQYAYDAAAKISSVNTLGGESILITLKPVKCGITEEHPGTLVTSQFSFACQTKTEIKHIGYCCFIQLDNNLISILLIEHELWILLHLFCLTKT